MYKNAIQPTEVKADLDFRKRREMEDVHPRPFEKFRISVRKQQVKKNAPLASSWRVLRQRLSRQEIGEGRTRMKEKVDGD